MPIRPEWRKYYRGPEWEAARNGELKRAGGKFDEKGKYIGGAKCRQCGKPDRERVFVVSHGFPLRQFWTADGPGPWRDCLTGRPAGDFITRSDARFILVKIGVAHLDHNPANRFEYNLRALCQWCHLHYDAPHHKQTRATRKDAARPLLREAAG
jgi:hypothetical protein